jgi:hypothetical protein
MMTYFKSSHHVLYVMNKYTQKFEILDSRNYAVKTGDVQLYTKSRFHTECGKIVSRENFQMHAFQIILFVVVNHYFTVIYSLIPTDGKDGT